MLMLLRSASLSAAVVAAVVAAAGEGDYAAIARLAGSGEWQAGDAAAAVAGLLGAVGVHDVNCRRGLAAAVTGRADMRGRGVLRSRGFAEAYGRAVAAGLAGLSEARRLLLLPMLLFPQVVLHLQWETRVIISDVLLYGTL